jgi:hypothetical protein
MHQTVRYTSVKAGLSARSSCSISKVGSRRTAGNTSRWAFKTDFRKYCLEIVKAKADVFCNPIVWLGVSVVGILRVAFGVYLWSTTVITVIIGGVCFRTLQTAGERLFNSGQVAFLWARINYKQLCQ